jgi:hypothetical protein
MEMVGMNFGKGDYGHRFDVDKVLRSLSEHQLFERVVCGICRDLPVRAVQTDVSISFLSPIPNSLSYRFDMAGFEEIY